MNGHSKGDRSRSRRSPTRCGFSLLEVIVATGMLATSTVLLLGLFSTGARHADSAERRVFAQMLCQSKLDELLADPSRLRTVDKQPLTGHPNWTYSVAWTRTDFEGLIPVRVSVSKVAEADRLNITGATPRRRAFELVRWMRYAPGDRAISDRNSDSLPSATSSSATSSSATLPSRTSPSPTSPSPTSP